MTRIQHLLPLTWQLAILITCGTVAQGASVSLDWEVFSAGGGASTGGLYRIEATLGQTDTSPQPLTGGAYSIAGGFWAVGVLPSPEAPLLSIERQGAAVRVFWPSTPGFRLEESLTATGAWSEVSLPYLTNANEISVIVLNPAGTKFYRLRQP